MTASARSSPTRPPSTSAFAPSRSGSSARTTNPVQTYQQFAWNLGQTVLRSESESHFPPADWPTFAQIDAWRAPQPGAAVPLRRPQVQPGRARDPDRGRRRQPGARLRAARARRREDRLDRPRAGAAGALLALRRGREPDRPLQARADRDRPRPARASRASTARRATTRRPPTGSSRPTSRRSTTRAAATSSSAPGIAAVNEWVNCVDAGAQCIALRRNPHPDEQDLNVPRCLFDGSRHRRLPGPLLRPARRLPRPGAPRHRARSGATGATKIKQGTEEGRFEEVDRRTSRRSGPARPACNVDLQPYESDETLTIDVTGIVCATGFVKSALSLPLLRRLAQTYGVPVTASASC